MTDDQKQTCLNELRSLVAEFYGEGGKKVDEREAARSYISSVQELAGKIDELAGKVNSIETGKADKVKEGSDEMVGDLQSLVKEVKRLEGLIAGKRDKCELPSDVDKQINELWKQLYGLENKYNEKGWYSKWDGFHPTLASFSPTLVSGSLTGAEIGVGGVSLKVRGWYFTFDILSVTSNGAKVKSEGAKSAGVWVASVLSCGIVGLVCASRMHTRVNAAKTELMRIANAASGVCMSASQMIT